MTTKDAKSTKTKVGDGSNRVIGSNVRFTDLSPGEGKMTSSVSTSDPFALFVSFVVDSSKKVRADHHVSRPLFSLAESTYTVFHWMLNSANAWRESPRYLWRSVEELISHRATETRGCIRARAISPPCRSASVRNRNN